MNEDLAGLLRAAAAHMLNHPDDPASFMRWGVQAVPEALFKHMDQPQGGQTVDAAHDARLAGLMSRSIYAAMPLPSRRWRPIKLALPERNEPCCCGSLRKFKHCCAPLAHEAPPFPPELCAGPMLDAMGHAAWAQLPQMRMPVALLGCVAEDWRSQGKKRWLDLVRLLEPWLPPQGPITDELADLLDRLGDVYADLKKPRKRKALALAMIERGSRVVQSKGWQRIALMSCDSGKYTEAHAAFQKSLRLDPDDPSLAILELSLLVGEGRTERLSERADFWARSLARKNQGGIYDDLIETIRDIGARGGDMLNETVIEHTPELKALAQWLEALPAPKLAQAWGPHTTPDDLGPLQADATLGKPLQAWRKVFQIDEPNMVQMGANDGTAWDRIDQWLPVLHQHPVLGNSFEVLDDLVRLLTTHYAPSAEHLGAQLTMRAMFLWRQIRALYPKAACEWGHWDNRPALRMIAQHIVADPSLQADDAFEWLQHLVEVLNPHDNHGFRERLMAVYVRRGLFDQALALSQRYPEDSDAMELLTARAHWAKGHQGPAMAIMQMVFERSSHFAKVWRSTKQPPPNRLDFIKFGSVQEAQAAYHEQHDLWQEPDLRRVVMAVSKKV